MERIPAEIGDRMEFTDDVALSVGEQATLPRSLRLIAYGFVFVGAMSLFEIVYLWFRDGNIFWNFNALLIFIGWGLFRLKPLAHGCASALVWIYIVGIVLVLVLFAGEENVGFGGLRFNPSLLSKVLVLSLVLFVLGLLWWIHKVLSSKPVKELFFARRPEKNRKAERSAFRFSIGNLMFLTALVAFMAARIGMDSELSHKWTSDRAADGTLVHLQFGLSRRVVSQNAEPNVAYLVIVHGNKSLVRVSGEHALDLKVPNRDSITLPSRTQIFEWRDETLHRSNLRITYAELEKLEKVLHNRWSLENLEAEVAKMRSAGDEKTETTKP